MTPLPPEAAAIAEALGLEPLEHEGGLYRQMFADGNSTAIYYLLAGGDFSALHRLAGPEVYHFYAGSPLRLLVLHPAAGSGAESGAVPPTASAAASGAQARAESEAEPGAEARAEELVLGMDLAAGQRPQIVVPGGTWHGSSSTGEWSLIGTTMAPPFDWAGFTLGDRADLTAAFPAMASRIAELTRG